MILTLLMILSGYVCFDEDCLKLIDIMCKTVSNE